MPANSYKLFYKSLDCLLKRKEFNLNAVRCEKESYLMRSGIESSARRIPVRRRKNSTASNDHEIPNYKIDEQKNLLYEIIKFFDKIFVLINKKMSSEDHDKFDIELLSTLLFQLFDKSQMFALELTYSVEEKNKATIGVFNENPTSNYTEFEPIYPESWANFSLIETDLEKMERLKRWDMLVKNSSLMKKLISSNIYITNRFIQKLLHYYNDNYVIKIKCRWECLYGYNSFVTFIYEQVRAKSNIREIDEILMDAITSVLVNNFYMNLFHSMLITKTDLNDSEQIDILLEFLANSLESMKLNKSRSLLNFEYTLIIKVVNHILVGDNFILIEKCLLFLYKYTRVMGDRFLNDLWERCLFNSSVYDLFLHWSSAVRKIFYHLIIFNYYENPACKPKIDKVITTIELEKSLYERNLKDQTLSVRQKLVKRKKNKILAKPKLESFERLHPKYRIYTPWALRQFREVENVYRDWYREYNDDQAKQKPDNRKDSLALPTIDIKILKDGLENSIIKKLS